MGTVLLIVVGVLILAAIGAAIDYHRICKRMDEGRR